MSREDQPASQRISLGACDCPGSPHDAQHTTALVSRAVIEPVRMPDGTSIDIPKAWDWDELDVTGDWADVVERADYGSLRYIGSAYASDDTGAGQARLIQKSVVAWNLVDATGAVLPINIPSIDKLNVRQSNELLKRLDRPQFQRQLRGIPETETNSPNGSGGSSANGQREPRARKRSPQPTAS